MLEPWRLMLFLQHCCPQAAVRALNHTSNSICTSIPDLEMWIIQVTLARNKWGNLNEIQLSIHLSSESSHSSFLLKNSYIPYQYIQSVISRTRVYVRPQQESKMEPLITYLYRIRTTRSPLLFYGDGIYHSSLFSCFLEGLEKATINRIFLTLPSRKESGDWIYSQFNIATS